MITLTWTGMLFFTTLSIVLVLIWDYPSTYPSILLMFWSLFLAVVFCSLAVVTMIRVMLTHL